MYIYITTIGNEIPSQRLSLLQKYSFSNYSINKREKNNIFVLKSYLKDRVSKIAGIRGSELLVLSEGISSYYTFYALPGNCKSVMINPLFHTMNGVIVYPSFECFADGSNIVLLSKNNSILELTVKFLKTNGYNRYYIYDDITNGVIENAIIKLV